MTMFQSVGCEHLASTSTLHCLSVDPVLRDSIGPNCMLLPALRMYSTPDPGVALGIREEHHRAPLGWWGGGDRSINYPGHPEGWRGGFSPTKRRGNQRGISGKDGERPEPCLGKQGEGKVLQEEGTEYAKPWS